MLCALNSQYIHSSLAPWYLLAGIEKYCAAPVRAAVFESTVNEDLSKTAERLIALCPDFIGFSAYIWNISRVRALLPLLRTALPNCVIALGGPEVSYNPEAVLKDPNVDFVLSGEGEYPLAKLLESLSSGGKIPTGCGINFIQGGKMIRSEPYITCEEPPNPYSAAYFEHLGGRISYIETSRGCPFSCAFCLSGRCGGVRFFSLERAKNDILRLANGGGKTVKFVDRTFNANPARAAEIVSFITENYGGAIPSTTCFHFEIAGDILDKTLIELFQKAPKGSIQLEIGLQSFNPAVLEAVTRKTDMVKLTDNIGALLKNNNIHIHIDLIAGLPYEDYASFGKGFDHAYRLNPHMLQLGFLKILHGSALEYADCGITYSAEPPYEVLSTPWLSVEELCLLHNTEHALDALYCSGRFRDSAAFLMEKTGLSPFDFYTEAGKLLESCKSPYEICGRLLDFCPDRFKKELRDVMAREWLTTNASGKLPNELRVPDGDVKKLALRLEQTGRKRPQNVQRGLALLYTEGSALYVDYTAPDRVTGRYEAFVIPHYKQWLMSSTPEQQPKELFP